MTRMVPLMHNYGDHMLCGTWCRAKKAKKEGKVYNVRPMFDVNNPKDIRTIQQIRQIILKFTTDECIKEMLHLWHTQLNESLNMRAGEVAPKYKNFSRTHSLRYRLMHVIGVNNFGYLKFYGKVINELGIVTPEQYRRWHKERDVANKRKKIHDNLFSVKRMRAHKINAKMNQAIFEERTNPNEYGHGIRKNSKIKIPKKKQVGTKHKSNAKKDKVACDCGGGNGHVHYRRSYKFCNKRSK